MAYILVSEVTKKNRIIFLLFSSDAHAAQQTKRNLGPEKRKQVGARNFWVATHYPHKVLAKGMSKPASVTKMDLE